MDALNILALGLAAKGGGGGGTTYTAGDNIDITNDEISVTNPIILESEETEDDTTIEKSTEISPSSIVLNYEESYAGEPTRTEKLTIQDGHIATGIDLESLEEDGSGAVFDKGQAMFGVVQTNYDENDEPTAINVQANTVASYGLDLMDADLLGYTRMNEARYGVSGISIENGEIFDPTTSAGQTFNFSVHSDGIGYGWSSNDGTDETSSSITLTTEDDKLLVNGTPVALEGGGGSAGAVRYDEAQSLTDAEKNQAKANQELPYISRTKTRLNNSAYSGGYSAGAQQVYIQPTWNVSKDGCAHLWLEGVNSNNTYTFKATITMTGSTSGTLVADDDETSQAYFVDNQAVYVANYISFNKKDTSSSLTNVGNYIYWTVYGDVPSYNNKLSGDLVDSGLLDYGKITSNSNTFMGVSIASKGNDTSGKSSYVGGWENVTLGNVKQNHSPHQYCVTVGWDNQTENNAGHEVLLGFHNNIGTGNRYANLVGSYLEANAYNKLPYIALGYRSDSSYLNGLTDFSYSATYSQGDLVMYHDNNNGLYVAESLQDNNKGHYPNTSDTAYWKFLGYDEVKKYVPLMVIGDGTDSYPQTARNALVLTHAGDIICNNIPACPTTDGTYNLQVTVTNGVPTYSWVAQS